MWYWEGDIRGCYSVKDGYRRLGVMTTQQSSVWNNVWKLQVPPKWKVFLWRALLNILPTLDNLIIRRVVDVNSCPSCGLDVECVMHIFCSCPYAVNVWQLSQIQIPPIANRNFVQWAEEWLGATTGFSSEMQGRICGVLHCIWSARSAAVWDAALPGPSALLSRLHAHWTAWLDTEHRRVAAIGRLPVTAPAQATSTTPIPFSCFVDASFHRPQRAPAFGFVVFGGEFSLVVAANGPLTCPYDPLLAEAMALCEALSWLKDNGYSGGSIYTDSSLLVSSLNSVSSFRNYFVYTLLACKHLINALPGTVVCFVNREANQVAHSLSKDVAAIAIRSVWRDVPHSFIEPMLANTI
ncbi:PREDICTED: uncharacterized protein LOC109155752 [Ipomoea nil]|uniref:uncharacterized protein LOC109155752 n=1 Tax=Ipomoea nil TaxID=35883 RepID=UPI000901AE79|nr:PREDICTED: uncharacterized protein LOC109155752 [Ipomoea nil]